MNIKDAQTEELFFKNIDSETGYTTRSMLCMPMKNRDDEIQGVFQLLNKKTGVFTSDDETYIQAFSIFASSAIENARLYEQEKEKIAMERDMIAAGEVQKALFPSKLPAISGYSIAAINLPAKNTSGDLYDFVELDSGNLIFALGDVSGKGLPASIIMAYLQSLLHSFPEIFQDTSVCTYQFNNNIERFSSSTKYVTLFFGKLDTTSHTISYTNAGHEHPILLRKNSTERLTAGGLPLGLFPGSEYQEAQINIDPGDLLVIFSDGVTDAFSSEKASFTEDRLKKLVTENRDLEPQKLVQLICEQIQIFVQDVPQFDDITVMILKRDDP